MRTIDAHVHLSGESAIFAKLLRRLETKILNICYAYAPEAWKRQREHYRYLADTYPDCYAWCTTFDLPDFRESDSVYAERVIAGLARDFDSGAAACKIWKNIGMECRRPSGEYLMVDDPLFGPIFDFIRKADRPVLMHIGEPRACWLPLDVHSPHYAYYSENPQWHMYGKSGIPSHAELIAARDRVLEANPKIRFVAAHLASLEYDVTEIAARLEKHPNLVVDTSARIADLATQDSATVRDFLIRYADRVLYGSDFITSDEEKMLPPARAQDIADTLEATYEAELSFLTSNNASRYHGFELTGLALPESVSRKILFGNAARTYGL